jgi:hypothetical protein
MSGPPVFAIVGRANKGKSSIVATLAEDDSVAIAPRPGTTTECREYPVRVDGEVLFKLVDTPGFEEAPRVLEWLRRRETSAASRPALVAEFVRAFEGTGDLVEERALLAPIAEGASILYVVDGTKPYRPNYEAEMEILRWTGRPAMALVNRIGEGDHAAEWHRALHQYFQTVRDFDAFRVTFHERLRLLRTFRELRPEEGEAFDRAVSALEAERRRRQVETAGVIAELLVDSLTFTLHVDVADEAQLEVEQRQLGERFHEALREREQRARRAVEELYRHDHTRWLEPEMERPELERDLFARETWNLLGLTPGQQVMAGAVAGATVGGAADAMVGAASFFTGAALGTLAGGGLAAYRVGKRFAQVRASAPSARFGLPKLGGDLSRAMSGRRHFTIGPHAQPNFPWVLLDRALLHYASVLTRTHARRDEVRLGERAPSEKGPVAGLPSETRRALDRAFAQLRKKHEDPPPEARRIVHESVLSLVESLEAATETPTAR